MFLEGPSPGVPGGKQPSPDGLLKIPELESVLEFEDQRVPYLIIVTDATDAVSVNFSGRCKFLLI